MSSASSVYLSILCIEKSINLIRILTKLDGTAKGGVIFAIARKLGLPIRFIGVGEALEDLRPFEADQFIEALFAGDDSTA